MEWESNSVNQYNMVIPTWQVTGRLNREELWIFNDLHIMPQINNNNNNKAPSGD